MRKGAVQRHRGTSLRKHSFLSGKPVCSRTTSIGPRAPPLPTHTKSSPLGASHCPTTLDLGLDDLLGMSGQAPEAEPRLPPAVRAHPLTPPAATGSPEPPKQPKGAEQGCPSPLSQSGPAP